MSVIADVFKELFSMFVGDARLTLCILALVAVIAACVREFPGVSPLLFGLGLLGGCLVIIVAITTLHARRVKGTRKS